MISFVIDGQPVPWARTRGGRTRHHFTPTRVREYQGMIRYYAQQKWHGQPLTDQPLNLAVRAYFPIPKSWSKRNRELAREGAIWYTKRPDLSNLIKAPEDALNGVLWRDDAQIVSYDGSGKWYSDHPRLEIEVTRA